jgi:uncharacterized protein with PIN domain
MAVNCPKCGSQYDVTLFEFGRTINCACGERVGLAQRIELPASAHLRFFADVMLHRLVRFLRALGLDTAWEDAIPDAELVRRSLVENRSILTLDRRLLSEWTVGNILLLQSDAADKQLREVVARFGIGRPPKIFTRCLICNTVLRPARRDEVLANVPVAIRSKTGDFRFCPACRKTYWEGSHTGRMRSMLDAVFDRPEDRPSD